MKTPIFDFVKEYAKRDAMRLHMPGHKGASLLGCESIDITEIHGADSLYEADGIIRESEANASGLFGCNTFYSTEGSSQCIRAMLLLALKQAKANGKKPLIMAGRNAHKVFLTAAALLDFEIEWLCSKSYLSCDISAKAIEEAIKRCSPAALYITSPDYLGNISDIGEIAKVCKKYGVLLLVDNAHGAYLRFLEKSLHPIDLGADMCCDSAHKTLPALTGAAYLHIKDDEIARNAKNALALFGSTSPSYLTLQSLDLVNKYIADGYKEKLSSFTCDLASLKDTLEKNGYTLQGNEPLKITIDAKAYGYSGYDLLAELEKVNIVCEFADPDFTVLMLTPENKSLKEIESAMLSIKKRGAIDIPMPSFYECKRIMSVREAVFAKSENVSIENALGRTISEPCVGCPPAVPIVMCGEQIDKSAIECFKYYGIKTCQVIKD